jgi:hypothetical protein
MPKTKSGLPTPLSAIRKKCLTCTCNQPTEVRLCPIEKCPLWLYRMGRRPDSAKT